MALSLVVRNGKHAGRSIRMKGSKLAIGRASDCHLRPDSDRISRHHCVILAKSGGAVVRDLGSRNGTHVNGEKIDADRSLANGDCLTVGRLELEVRMTAEDAATAGSSSRSGTGSKTSGKSPKGTSAIRRSKSAASTVDAPADKLELVDEQAGRRTSSEPTADKPTQTLKLGKGQSANAPATAPAEKPKTKEEDHRSDHIVSEEEKEKARNTRAIVGVSKAAQAKRVTGTSSGAAAEALRRFRR